MPGRLYLHDDCQGHQNSGHRQGSKISGGGSGGSIKEGIKVRLPNILSVTGTQTGSGIRSPGTATKRLRKIPPSLEDQNLQGLPQAEATDRILSSRRLRGRPLYALQSLLCRRAPSPLPQEPRTSPGAATRLLRCTQRGDLRSPKRVQQDPPGVRPRVQPAQ